MKLINMPQDEIDKLFEHGLHENSNTIDKSLEVYLHKDSVVNITTKFKNIIEHILNDYKKDQLKKDLLLDFAKSILQTTITMSYTDFLKNAKKIK